MNKNPPLKKGRIFVRNEEKWLQECRENEVNESKKIDKTIDISGITIYSEFYYPLLWRSVLFCVEAVG